MGEDDPYKMNAKQFGSAMSQIAHGQAVMAAVRDYKKVRQITVSAPVRMSDYWVLQCKTVSPGALQCPGPSISTIRKMSDECNK